LRRPPQTPTGSALPAQDSDSSTPAESSGASDEKDEKKKEPHVTLFELSKDMEDREILVLGLKVYAKDGCLESVIGKIPERGQGSWVPEGGWPIAEV